ncbi:hypothetical protein HanIR_Chr16g0817591 [Helianthus annuus]|nr:hypothetical protein HanIR_Chr16g0817591 [Helianthus annuus]
MLSVRSTSHFPTGSTYTTLTICTNTKTHTIIRCTQPSAISGSIARANAVATTTVTTSGQSVVRLSLKKVVNLAKKILTPLKRAARKPKWRLLALR